MCLATCGTVLRAFAVLYMKQTYYKYFIVSQQTHDTYQILVYIGNDIICFLKWSFYLEFTMSLRNLSHIYPNPHRHFFVLIFIDFIVWGKIEEMRKTNANVGWQLLRPSVEPKSQSRKIYISLDVTLIKSRITVSKLKLYCIVCLSQ